MGIRFAFALDPLSRLGKEGLTDDEHNRVSSGGCNAPALAPGLRLWGLFFRGLNASTNH
jgi:hypothetical protein